MGADGEVFGVFEEALAGGILAQAVGEAGHGVEPAPVDGEGAHAVEGRGLAIDGAGGRPGGAPGELVLADLIGGQRGGPRVAAEEGDEMGDPAAGGALGPELPDLVVLEVGVAELSQGRPLGAERARVAAPSRRVTPGVPVEPVSCGVMAWVPPVWRPRAGGRRATLALWGAAGKRNVRGTTGPRGSADRCGCRRRPAAGGAARHRPLSGRMIGRVSRDERPSPDARPARRQAHSAAPGASPWRCAWQWRAGWRSVLLRRRDRASVGQRWASRGRGTARRGRAANPGSP